jgi:hypothetical protein
VDHNLYFCLVMCSSETAVGPDNAGASLNVSNDGAFFFFCKKKIRNHRVLDFSSMADRLPLFCFSLNFYFGLLEWGIMCKSTFHCRL